MSSRRVTVGPATPAAGVLIAIGLVAFLVVPGASRAAVIAKVGSPTSISAWGGVQVWSNGGSPMVRQAGRISVLRGARGATDSDVGPGPDGRPRIVYADSERNGRLVIRRPDGTGRRVVPKTTGASLPTISGSRIAWLAGDGTLRSSRIDGTERRRLTPPLAEATASDIRDLELSGSRLAVAASYDNVEIGDEVGIVDLVTGRRTAVNSVVSAESGRTLLGLSWARGRLFHYQTCINVSGRCSSAISFDPRNRSYERLRSLNRLEGFAVDDDGIHAFVIPRTAGDPIDWTATTVQRVKLKR